MVNAKQKGNSHERAVAKMLSEWAGVKFMRTPMSGAIHNFNDVRVVSDIVAPLSIGKFPFSIECKNVEYSWEVNTYTEGKGEFFTHWAQALSDAEREGLEPLLVFTKKYREIYVALRTDTFELLEELGGKYTYNYIELHSDKVGRVSFLKFSEMLDSYSLQVIQELSENLLK